MKNDEFLKKLEIELKIAKNSEHTLKIYIKINKDFLEYVGKEPLEISEEDIKLYNSIYAKYFNKPLPSRSTIVNVLPTFLKFELDCIAYAPKTRQEAD